MVKGETMTNDAGTDKQPLWLSMEETILGLADGDFSGNPEQLVHKTAKLIDDTGHNVSGNGSNLLELRWALEARRQVGRPMLSDLRGAVDGLTLDDVADTYRAMRNVVGRVGETWPRLKDSARRPDLLSMIDEAKLGLLTAKAQELGGDKGIRYLIEAGVEIPLIIERLAITQEKYDEVNAAVEAEKAERSRVQGLIDGAGDKSVDDKIKLMINENVEDALMIELAGVTTAQIKGVKDAMEAEIREKERLAAEAEARKKAEAEGPSLDAIEPSDMLEHIEAIREILDFSDVEKEIRTMCEQSSIPKCLVDIAVSEPDKLDELEEKAEAAG